MGIKTGSKEHAKILEIYYQAIKDKKQQPKLFNGIIPAVQKIAKKYDIAIVSSAKEDYIKSNLEPVEKYIKLIVSQDSCPNIKPNPDPFLHLANKLDIAPWQIIAVGDTKADIISAREAGIENIIAVTYGKFEDRAELDSLNPDQLLDTIKQLRYI